LTDYDKVMQWNAKYALRTTSQKVYPANRIDNCDVLSLASSTDTADCLAMVNLSRRPLSQNFRRVMGFAAGHVTIAASSYRMFSAIEGNQTFVNGLHV